MPLSTQDEKLGSKNTFFPSWLNERDWLIDFSANQNRYQKLRHFSVSNNLKGKTQL